jgi:NAD+ diphosphatase
VNGAPREYAFQHAGLDRAEHLREKADALGELWPRARVMLFDEGRVHFHGELEAPSFPTGAELPWCSDASFLGLDGEQPWFAAPIQGGVELPGTIADLRSVAAHWPALQAAICAQGRALLRWQSRSRFCGECGARNQFIRGGFASRCSNCGGERYPRTDPAVIVAVSDGERLLLGRQAGWPEGRWSVLAGFCEPGESLEQTVVREVLEEAGVRVASCEYAGSQPWPFPASLMIGFHALAEPQPVQVGDELEAAAWFTAEELREQFASGAMKASPRLSISRWLLEDWLRRQGEGDRLRATGA